MTEVAKDVLYHHERWDGTGYPGGLKEEKIPLVSRIIAIADDYDIISGKIKNGSPLSEEVVLAALQKKAGSQFDPKLIKVFIDKGLGKSVAFK